MAEKFGDDRPLIFISYEGRDFALAELLKRWVGEVFQEQINVFVAAKDIKTGKQWFDAIQNSVRSCEMVIAIYSENTLNGNWVHFEAGSAWGRSKDVMTLYHGALLEASIPAPLKAYQVRRAEGTPTFVQAFLERIRDKFQLETRGDYDLERRSRELKNTLFELNKQSKTYEVFLSIPMRNASVDEAFTEHTKGVQKILAVAETAFESDKVYFGGKEMIANPGKKDRNLFHSTSENSEALLHSKRFILVYPSKVVSTSLIELGIAVGRGIPTAVFYLNLEHIPKGFQVFHNVNRRVAIHAPCSSLDDIAEQIKESGKNVFRSEE